MDGKDLTGERAPRVQLGAALALAAALAWAGCGGEAAAPPAPVAPAAPIPAARADAPAPPAAAPGTPRWVGVVLASNAVDVAAETSGRLRSVAVAVGDRVGPGQVLAQVDTSLLQSDLERAAAALREARADLVRATAQADQAQLRSDRRAGTPEIFSKEDLENAALEARATRTAQEAAEARVQQEQAGVERLRRGLAQGEIRAPFAGTVAQLHLTAGASVAPGAPVIRLVTAGEVLTRFAVPPDELRHTAVGRTVAVEAAADRTGSAGAAGVAWRAVVSRIAPEIDVPSQRVFVEARIALPAVGAGVAGSAPAPRLPLPSAGLAVWVRPRAGEI